MIGNQKPNSIWKVNPDRVPSDLHVFISIQKHIHIYILYIGSQIYQTIKLDCKAHKSHVFKKKMVHIIISKFRPKKRPSSFPLTSPIHPFLPQTDQQKNTQGPKAPLNMPTCLEQSKRELPESRHR